MKTFNRFAVLAILVLTTALCSVSCTDDDKDGEGPVLPQATPKAIVVNEGGMGSGLSDLSVLYTDGSIVNDPFRRANNNRPLGDVAQFMDCFNGKYFVTLNGSNKIEVIDTADFKSVATIVFDEDCKPRYMAAVNDSTAVVSDMNRKMMLINTKTNKFIEYIETGNTYEQMLTVGNKLFCANMSAENIAVYNTNDLHNPRFIDMNNYPFKSSPLILDRNGNIWVYCAIENNNTAPKVFVKFDPETEQVLETISLPDSIKTNYLRMDRDSKGDKIYFDGYVPGGWSPDVKYVYTIDVDTHEFAKYVALRGTEMIYGMNVDADGGVWVCDCLDYSRQRGYLRYYPANNSDVLTSWRVGIYPNYVYFPDKNK